MAPYVINYKGNQVEATRRNLEDYQVVSLKAMAKVIGMVEGVDFHRKGESQDSIIRKILDHIEKITIRQAADIEHSDSETRASPPARSPRARPRARQASRSASPQSRATHSRAPAAGPPSDMARMKCELELLRGKVDGKKVTNEDLREVGEARGLRLAKNQVKDSLVSTLLSLDPLPTVKDFQRIRRKRREATEDKSAMDDLLQQFSAADIAKVMSRHGTPAPN